MRLIRRFLNRIKNIFRKSPVKKNGKIFQSATVYPDTLNKFLAEHPLCKAFRFKKRNARNIWEGEASSMHQAYLLFVSLPDINISDITHHHSADDLFYRTKVHGVLELELTNRARRKWRGATISLRREDVTLLQIKLNIKE